MDAGTYKILIADDEYWTREKIRNMIQWEKYGLEFLEPAVDGEDVLNKIQAEKPDILITDINMPFINGVQLLSVLKDKYPEIITFVISGYDDFNYVKDTFMSGSINYLVKPVSKIDLVNALSNALEIISDRQKMQLKASSLMQDREFSLLVEREETPFTPMTAINSNIDFTGFSMMLIKIHNMKELAKKYRHDMNQISYAMKKEIKNIISSEGILVFNHIYRSNEFIVVTDMDNDEIRKAADRILVFFSPIVQSSISICVSEHIYTLDSIHVAYIQSVALFMTRKYIDKNEILFSNKNGAIPDNSNINSRINEEHEKQLKSLLLRGNKSALKSMVFESIGLRGCQNQCWSYLEVKQTVKRILNIFTDYISNHKQPKDVVDMEQMVDAADKMIESLDSEALCDILDEIIEFAASNSKEEASDSIRSLVKQAVQYIDTHYFEEINLSSLSQQFNVESSYFSKMFRQETGENPMVYITRLRMEKAKEYMKNKGINLTEIAFMVGYDDYTYFSRVFRKVEGKSPRDFRNNI